MDFPGGSVVKKKKNNNNNLPSKQETQVQSLGREDSWKEMATHSSMLAWEILWTEKLGRATVHGVEKESDATE